MFHIKHYKFHTILFFLLVFLIPIQTRIIYFPDQSYIESYFSYHLSFFVYLTDIIFFTLISVWFLFDKPKFKLGLFEYAAILWLIIAFFSLFHVERPILSIYTWVKLFEVIFLAAYIKIVVKNTSDYIKVFTLLFISGVFQSVLTIYQFVRQKPLGLKFLGEYFGGVYDLGVSTFTVTGEKIIRAYGTFPHPNVLGGFLLISLLSALYLVSRGTNYKRILVSCGTVFILLGMFLSFSRIIWAVGLLILILYIIFYLIYVKHSFTAFVSFCILVFSILTYTFFGSYASSRILNPSETDRAINYRTSFNKMALSVLNQNIFFGVGLGNYIPSTLNNSKLEPWEHQPAHNIFIHIAAETGILGLILFLIIIYASLRSTWNSQNKQIRFTLLLGGFSIIIISLFDHYFVTIQQGQLTFFLFLGLMLAASNIESPNKDKHDKISI